MLDKVAFSVAHQIRHTQLIKASLPDSIVAQIDLSGLDELDNITPDTQAAAADAALSIAAESGYDTQLFNQLNTRAADFAKQRAAEMVTEITDSTRDDLLAIISGGIDSGMTKDDIADLITQQDSYLFSDERAQLIASTEIGIANGQGALASYKEIEALGVSIMKEWLPDANACEVCQANADQGPIPIEDDFDSGDDSTPAHPNCECTTISVYPNKGE